ncbi:MAG: hypothetical protein Q9212_002128 [Teloschistes hypoglaucus]
MKTPKATCKFDFDEEIVELLHQRDISNNENERFVHPEIDMCREAVKALSSLTESRCTALRTHMRQHKEWDAEDREFFDGCKRRVSEKVVLRMEGLVRYLDEFDLDFPELG